MLYTKYLVEFLGTLLLTYTIFATGNWAFIGIALAVAVLLGGKISGGAFNPAVALGFWYAGRLSPMDTMMYIFVEILGAFAGYHIYRMF